MSLPMTSGNADRRMRRSSRALMIGEAMLGAVCLGAPAFSQTLNSGQGASSSQQVANPRPAAPSSEPPLPAPESLFPGMFGARTWLTDQGIAVLLDTIEELGGNISGGGGPPPDGSRVTTGGGTSLDGQVGFETDVNWEKLAGITGFSTNSIIVARYGGLPASAMIGDTLNPSSEVYGGGGNVVAHLVQFYGQETLAGGGINIQAGRIPLDDYFDASPLFCAYEQNSLCGNPKNFAAYNFSHVTYPDAGWAVHFLLAPSPHAYLQSGIYFSQTNFFNYGENFRSGFNFDTSYTSGEAFPVEIGYVPLFNGKLPGHYKLGFVYDNNPHTDEYFSINGAPFEANGLPQRVKHGARSVYVQIDQMVTRTGPGPNQGLVLLAGYSHNDPETSLGEDQYYAGAQDGGFWAARPLDQINLLLTYQNVSGLAGKSQAIALQEGLPPQLTVGGASGIQTWTMTFEGNYAIHVYRGFTFAPDFQYYIRPNAQSNLPDAAFLGFKTHIEFF